LSGPARTPHGEPTGDEESALQNEHDAENGRHPDGADVRGLEDERAGDHPEAT
jgi:hypothetical protein